jgi:formylglycine-generating enzyme required for sulfatase activity
MLNAGPNEISIIVAAEDPSFTKKYSITVTGPIAPTTINVGALKYVPWGTFQRDADSRNLSFVSGFWMSKHLVTRQQFSTVMGTDPSSTGHSTGMTDPIQNLNWYQAIAFCNKLSLLEGLVPAYTVDGVNFTTLIYSAIPITNNSSWNAVSLVDGANGYRLPTVMEWMWAGIGATSDGLASNMVDGINRGGYLKNYPGSSEPNGAYTNIGNYSWTPSVPLTTHPVGGKLPNELGLFDMGGNTGMWMWDNWGPSPQGNLINFRNTISGDGTKAYCGISYIMNGSVFAEVNGKYPYAGNWDLGLRVVRY